MWTVPNYKSRRMRMWVATQTVWEQWPNKETMNITFCAIELRWLFPRRRIPRSCKKRGRFPVSSSCNSIQFQFHSIIMRFCCLSKGIQETHFKINFPVKQKLREKERQQTIDECFMQVDACCNLKLAKQLESKVVHLRLVTLVVRARSRSPSRCLMNQTDTLMER